MSKKILLFLFLSLLMAIFAGCEQDVADTNALVYKEQLVIRGFIYASSNSASIQVSRTLHPLANYDANATKIADASVSIIHNEQQYPLYYNAATNAYESNDIIFQAGETYQLKVNRKKLAANATTTIPRFEIVEKNYETSIFEDDNYGYVYGALVSAKIKGDKNIAYYLGYREYANISSKSFYYDGLIYSNDADIVFSDLYFLLSDSLKVETAVKNASFDITAFDNQFYEYAKTRSEYDTWSLFGTDGTNPKWNVTGDGIGLFIGCNNKEFSFN